MPFNIGWMELVVVLVVALIIFGPGKLPDVGKALGKSIREFKGAVNKVDSEIKKEMEDIKSTVDLKDVTNVVSATATTVEATTATATTVEATTAEPTKVDTTPTDESVDKQ